MSKKWFLSVPVVVLLFLSCAGARVSDLPGGKVKHGSAVLKVNDMVFGEADLGEAMNRLIPRVSFHRALTAEKRASYRAQAIEDMIEKELLYQEALKRGMTVDKSRIESARETAEKKYGKKAFKEALKKAGLTKKEFDRRVEKNILVERVIEVEITQKARVSEEEAREHYEKNKTSYLRPDARRLRHILISVPPEASAQEKERRKKRALEALEKAKKGADFSRLAWDYSDGPYRVKGGDLGLIHRGRLDPVLEEASFGLGQGELSGVIESIYGYHIFLADEVKPSEQLDFGDVAQQITRMMTEQKMKELREALVSGLRAGARIEVY